MTDTNHKPAPVERLLERYYQSPEPAPAFTERLGAQLQAKLRAGARSQRPGLPALWRWATAAALFLLLVGLALFAFRVRPQPLVGQASTITASAEATRTLAPTFTPAPPPAVEPVNVPLVVSPRFCALAPTRAPNAPTATPGPLLGQPPDNPAYSQMVMDGDAQFFVNLYCDLRFGYKDSQTFGNEFSEIQGLGLRVSVDSLNKNEGLVDFQEYAGFAPYVRYAGGGSNDHGISSTYYSGIRFPDDVLIDLARSETPLRYIYRVDTSQNTSIGISLRFTLQAGPDGYFPANISLEPLTAAELQSAQYAAAPLPTRSPASLSPVLAELRDLLDRQEQALLDSPGWLHIVSRMENQEKGGTLPNGAAIPANYTMESWYQLGEKRVVRQAITIARYTESSLDQISVYRDRVWVNKTMNTTFSSPNESLGSLDSGLYASAVRALRAGDTLIKTVENGTVIFTIQRPDRRDMMALDSASGKMLWNEEWRLEPSGWQLFYRSTDTTLERAAQPPADILALMDAPATPYQPLPPAGTPAPAGFDPSASPLRLVQIAGDDFTQPTFWYSDIYAGEYLLGRVDFGDAPGGWCVRSTDGARIAFQYRDAKMLTTLHWLELSDLANVHAPLPDLRLLSALSWSPQGHTLAFSACAPGAPGAQNCGTYLLDTDTGESRRISAQFFTPWHILWKPDGSQLALITSENDVQNLVVLDAASGETRYSGPANYPTFDPAAPVTDWGVTFPAGATGFGACEAKP